MIFVMYFFNDVVDVLEFFVKTKGLVLGYADTVDYGKCFFTSKDYEEPKTLRELETLGWKDYEVATGFRSFLGTDSTTNSPRDVSGLITVLAERVVVTVPSGIEKRFGIPNDADVYWLYWTPFGDEAMLGYAQNGIAVEETSDWQAFLDLMRINPHLEKYPLGDSDNEPEMVLVVDRKRRNSFVLSMKLLGVLHVICTDEYYGARRT